MQRVLLLFTIFLVSFSSLASVQQGTVTNVIVRDDGLHWFILLSDGSGERSERPECSATHTYWMIKDENTRYGQSQFSMLLAAYMAKTPVKITGKHSCTRWGDGEDISTVQLLADRKSVV